MNGAKKGVVIMANNKPKKYVAIIKIANNPDGSAHCVKYRFNEIMKFMPFLDSKYKDWRWMNVYKNVSPDKGRFLKNFTKNKRPVKNEL
ncbi:MAG: hypothetical protein ACOC3S_01330 [Bacteroidota bacterium]